MTTLKTDSQFKFVGEIRQFELALCNAQRHNPREHTSYPCFLSFPHGLLTVGVAAASLWTTSTMPIAPNNAVPPINKAATCVHPPSRVSCWAPHNRKATGPCRDSLEALLGAATTVRLARFHEPRRILDSKTIVPGICGKQAAAAAPPPQAKKLS